MKDKSIEIDGAEHKEALERWNVDRIKKTLNFGDFVRIEQKRHGADNEMYLHKVIGALNSNTYTDVPVQQPATDTHHMRMSPVLSCICCGVSETRVRRYRLEDVNLTNRQS